ncbi:MAG: PAS domain S-box protein [Chloroflexi bacterium]|nr:PAS domain S-box protein [Chloroflexota bacterium]
MSTSLDSKFTLRPKLSQALMQAALMTVGEAILSINSESAIVMANPEIEDVFGHHVEELLGQHLHILMPEKYRDMHSGGVKRYLTTGIPKVLGVRLELEGLRKDGSIFPLEIRIMPTLIEEERFFTAAMRDISDKKKKEQRLEIQQEQLSKQTKHLARVQHFFQFTLENMEMTLQRGAEYEELLTYIQQVKGQSDSLNREKPKA